MSTDRPDLTQPITIHSHIYRGENRLRIALVGQPNSGKSKIFNAVASTSYHKGKLTGTHKPYAECPVQIGMDEIHLVDLPGIHSLRGLAGDDLEALKYLLWGDARPLVSSHEHNDPPTPFSRPDIIVHVIDASVLARSLELTLELAELGLPMVIALNMMDEARRKGVDIDVQALSEKIGVPVIPTTAIKGHGLSALFEQVLNTARSSACPLPQAPASHIQKWAARLQEKLDQPELYEAFAMPKELLIMQLLEADNYFMAELGSHFPEAVDEVKALQLHRSG